MRKSRYKRNDHNAICDVSGFKMKRSQMKKTWDGLLVGRKFWDPKHPQLNLRGRTERISVQDARPRPDTIQLQDTPTLYATLVNYSGESKEVANTDSVVNYAGESSTPSSTLVNYNGDQVEVFTRYVGSGLDSSFKVSDIV